MDYQSLQSWHKELADTPSGPAARGARWHETVAKFDLSVVYVPRKYNTVADCLSRGAYPAGKAWIDISTHGNAKETAEAKRIIDAERFSEEGEAKCFVVMGSRTELAQAREAKVQALEAQLMEEGMVRAIEGVQSVSMNDWSDVYANLYHWLKYWNAVSAPSDDDQLEGLTEDWGKLFLKDKRLVPEDRVEDWIYRWHNTQLIHPGPHKLHKFLLGYYTVILNLTLRHKTDFFSFSEVFSLISLPSNLPS